MNGDLISIIVPIYKVELYLEKCLESILNQTYKNIEIILVDDESPDNCGVICDRYKEIDERIRVIHKKNGGLSDARNAGLKISKGKYILFVDSDDYLQIDLLENVYKYIVANDLDLVCFNYSTVNENYEKGESCILDIEDRIYSLNSDIEFKKYLIKNIYSYKDGVEAWNKLYKASIIKDNELKFTYNNEIFAEDLLFNLSYLIHVKSVGTISNSYYNYLLRESSIMGQPKKDLFIRYKTLFLRLEEYWNKYNRDTKSLISLGYFIWLISTIKIKLNEDIERKMLLNEFKQVSESEFFIKKRNEILLFKSVKQYIKFNPKKLKHAALIYTIALLCFIKQENLVVNIIDRYIK